MGVSDDGFGRANNRFRQRAYKRWHDGQLKRQILRSQIGFTAIGPSRPAACLGCANYHGQAYGLQKTQRVMLVCAMHPYGWQAALPCPDWDPPADAPPVDPTVPSVALYTPRRFFF